MAARRTTQIQDQVVDHGRRACAGRTAGLHVPNEVGTSEGMRNGVAERMRTTAVYRVEPFACSRALIAGMVIS